MKILITGATGMLGTKVVEALLKKVKKMLPFLPDHTKTNH